MLNKEALIAELDLILKECDPVNCGSFSLKQAVVANQKLPLDSLGHFEMAQRLEEKFNVSLTDEELKSIAFSDPLVNIMMLKVGIKE